MLQSFNANEKYKKSNEGLLFTSNKILKVYLQFLILYTYVHCTYIYSEFQKKYFLENINIQDHKKLYYLVPDNYVIGQPKKTEKYIKIIK